MTAAVATASMESLPVASTSRISLDTEPRQSTAFLEPGPSKASEERRPSLAQLLHETVVQGRNTSLPSLPALNSPVARGYISSLLSQDLSYILKEPDELRKHSEVLDADLANLCYRSTGDLLGVGECVDGVQDGFGKMQSNLDSLLTCAEDLSSSCTAFSASTAPVTGSRNRLTLVRSHISSIEDILSIPRLVSTCVRGGWWNEAMELAQRARELEALLTSKSPQPSRRNLLGKVREEVDTEVKSLRARIIEGLRSRSLKLPTAVRSISLLRRMSRNTVSKRDPSLTIAGPLLDSFSEEELRLTFLASRFDCLRTQLHQLELAAASGASNDDRLRYLKRWIEVWREIVGETVNIYGELFLQQQSTTLEQIASISQTSHTLLTLFLQRSLAALTSLLESQLPRITTVSVLASLQTQLAYCSAAFTKFGFDFRFVCDALIVRRLEQLTSERFEAAGDVLLKDLLRARTQSGARDGKARLVLEALYTSEARDSILSLNVESIDVSHSGNPKSQPSPTIVFFPPLARFLNAHVTALNELRLMPVASSYLAIRTAQIQHLESSITTLRQFLEFAVPAVENSSITSPNPGSSNGPPESDSNKLTLKHFVAVFARALVPWCRWGLEVGVYSDVSEQNDQASQNDGLDALCQNCLEAVGITKLQNDDPPPHHADGQVGGTNGQDSQQSPSVKSVKQFESTSAQVGGTHSSSVNGTLEPPSTTKLVSENGHLSDGDESSAA